LGAAFHFLGELVAQEPATEPPGQMVDDLRKRLTQCVAEDKSGRQQLTITLPNKDTLDNLANTLARLLAVGQAGDQQHH
jgi:hypothetical protein